MKKKHIWRSLLLSSAILFAYPSNQPAEAASVENISGTVKWQEPQGLWIDPTGNLLVVDTTNHTIHSITEQLTKASVIGQNSGLDAYGLPLGGYIDANANTAMFNNPTDIVVDSKGIIYISDAANHTIRKVVNGAVYTHAGTGEAGYQNGTKTQAQFNYPAGLALDANDHLYVADSLNHVIRKVTPDGFVTTVAGTAVENGGYKNGSAFTAQFNEPSDVEFGADGQLFVSDSGNQVIRQVVDGQVTTYAGVAANLDAESGYYEGGYQNGLKDTARFNFPKGLDYADGYLFVADSLNNRVRAITPNGSVVNLAGQSEAGKTLGDIGQAQFDAPSAVQYSNGTLFVTDTGNKQLKSFPVDLTNVVAVQSDDDVMNSTPLLPASATPQIWLNGKQVAFNEKIAPIKVDGKTYIPVHAFFKEWGATVKQLTYKKSITVVKDQTVLSLTIDEQNILLKDGRSYIEAGYLQTLKPFTIVEVQDYNAVIIQSAN
ncbi:MAG: stalk domain-containing protein [Solibacillus sp.]